MTQGIEPLPDVSGSGGGPKAVDEAPAPSQPDETEQEIDSSLQAILQGAVNVDWAETADPPKVCIPNCIPCAGVSTICSCRARMTEVSSVVNVRPAECWVLCTFATWTILQLRMKVPS